MKLNWQIFIGETALKINVYNFVAILSRGDELFPSYAMCQQCLSTLVQGPIYQHALTLTPV